MDKMQNSSLLNNIAFDLVKEKVIQDKLEEAQVDAVQNLDDDYAVDLNLPQEIVKDQFPDLEEPDSEEERIMQRELNKRGEIADSYIEKQREKARKRYGDLVDIVETEFIDTMLKNENVVCHFYHDSFDRCKILDKHLRIIAESHHDTMFVRINAEKTPFFTSKLNIQDGKAFDRVIGFEELGMKDEFPTINLTRRLVRAKIIKPLNKQEKGDINIQKLAKLNDDYDY